ncbi:MAG: tryptophan--tRNA ligase [bacterium]
MRALSGIKPTGILHIGNYLGAARQFEEMQQKSYQGFYFIADYHTLNMVPDPEKLSENTWNVVIDYLAFGLDPEKTVLFLQSQVPEVVELAFILGNVTPMGLLQRSHSYKDHIEKGESINVGLFYYPLLMTADILLYDADIVPVGRDQKQHVEIARDIAEKFNMSYDTDILKLPEPYIPDEVAVVPGRDGRKMSKSYGNTIEMFAPKKVLKKQIMSIKTDSTPLEEPKNPDKCNVFKIYSLFAEAEDISRMREKYEKGGFGYGHAKKELALLIEDYFAPMRKLRAELEKNPSYVRKIIDEGSKKAREEAIEKIRQVKKVTGIQGNIYTP